MKSIRAIRFVFLGIAILAGSTSTISLRAAATDAVSATPQEHPTVSAQDLTTLFAEWHQRVEILQAHIQRMAGIVSTSKTLSPKERVQAKEFLNVVSRELADLKAFPYADLTLQEISTRFTIFKALIACGRNLCLSGYTKIPVLQDALEAALAVTNARGTPTVESIIYLDQECTAELQTLEKQLTKSELTSYQRVYRALAHGIGRYKVIPRAKKIAGFTIGGLALYASYHYMLDQEGLPIHPSFYERLSHTFGKVLYMGAGAGGMLKTIETWDIVNKSYGISTTILAPFHAAHSYLMGKDGKHLAQSFDIERQLNKNLDSPEFKHLQHVVEPLRRAIDYIMNPAKFAHAGIQHEKGFIITGISGGGKTYIAQAFAASLQQANVNNKINYIPICVGDFGYNIDRLVDFMRYHMREGACVFFIDEFHTLGLRSDANKLLLANFLSFMDEINNNNDAEHSVTIIAATNHPEQIDQALFRPGRFKRINIDYPNYEARLNLLQVRCSENAIQEDAMNLEHIAHLTNRCSFSDLNTLFNTALADARHQARALQAADLYNALNSVIRKIKDAASLTTTERNELAAYHAGTALAHLSYNPNDVHLDMITIRAYPQATQQRGDWYASYANTEDQHMLLYGKTFVWRNNERIASGRRDQLMDMLRILIAGHVAQELLLGSASIDYRTHDEQSALEIAQTIVLAGVSMDSLSENKKNEMRDKAFDLVATERAAVKTLLTEQKERLEKVAAALEEREMLTAQEIETIR